MKLKTLINVSFFFLSMLLIIGTSIGFFAAYTTKQNIETINDQYIKTAAVINRLHESSAILHVYLHESAQSGQLNLQAFNDKAAVIAEYITNLKSTALAGETPSEIKSINTDWENVIGALNNAAASHDTSASQSAAIESALNQFDATLQVLDSANNMLASTSQENANTNFRNLETFVIVAGLIGVVITILVGIYLTHQIFNPFNIIASRLNQVKQGLLTQKNVQFEQLARRDNELGQLARNLRSVDEYLISISQIANEMSQGNLTVVASPRSGEDELGTALNLMTQQLHALISQANDFSRQVNQASYELSQTIGQTDRNNGEITSSINQINDGIGYENKVVSEGLVLVEQTNAIVDLIGSHAQQQQQATDQASAATADLNKAIEVVMENAGNVAESSNQSTAIVQSGSTMLTQTIDSINQIQQQVTNIAGRVKVMGERSHDINLIVDTIEQIASTTNILAINATIEAAHAKIQSEKLTEDILNQMMLSECHMIQHMLDQGASQNPTQFWKNLCSTTSLDTILVTDGDGVVTLCNENSLLNWRFPDDPNSQTYPFRQLLNQKSGAFCQDAQARSLDNQVFKYVGISRNDQPGIIQVGFMMSTLKKFDLHINGFGVVAEEVYHLAERAHVASKEIRKLVISIQQSTGDVIESVDKSSDYISVSLQKALNARDAIHQILTSIDQVLGHTSSTMQATKNMQDCTLQLTNLMDAVGQTVASTQKAAREMGEAYAFIQQTFKQVATLASQNSIATVQVRASSQGMKTQMNAMVESSNALAILSRNLQTVLGRFNIA